ncbi:S1C family serine protease [Geothrix edaphica]|uniref:S1C family serine protease n=1 Tax=Geothrix edaphica TaxID=2927976 RepID=UPI0025567738|nr:trypsin-like peptidase domain-containing protein [Geothrix edaphica]
MIGQQTRSLWCSNPTDIVWNENLQKVVGGKLYARIKKELATQHIPEPKASDSVFESTSKPEEAELELGVLLKKMTLNLCTTVESKGDVSLEAKWALLNPKTQKVVGEFTSTGSFVMPTRDMHWAKIVDAGIDSLVSNLFLQPSFKEALVAPLPSGPAQAEAAFTFPAVQALAGGTVKNSALIQAAVVTVETGSRTGTGFYISRDGHLLTANHVLGNSKLVKIKTATGRVLPGEVLSCDPKRDVALVKTAAIPFDPLPIRAGDPGTGEEVFAIGSPLGDTFNGSVTRGVVSGFRDAPGGRFLQSDVSILPGNSGGPLVDAAGYVVGIADLATGLKGGNMNFFIPAAEALTKLSIHLAPSGSAQTR